MFRTVQKSFFRGSRVFALACIGLLCSAQAQSFQLDSKSIVLKEDHFSSLKKEIKYKELNTLIENCRGLKKKLCLEKAQILYIDPEFVFFKNLIVELSLDLVLGLRFSISKLSFIRRDDFNTKSLSRIFKRYESGEVEPFFGERFFYFNENLEAAFLNFPSLICKYAHKNEFTQSLLKKLPQEKDYLEKDYSSFPCQLKLVGPLEDLDFEIRKSKGRSAFDYEYSFSFLRNKVSKKAYRLFPKYRKRNLSYKKKKTWKKILTKEPFIQVRIARNLFYSGKYKILAHASTFSKGKLEKISVEAMEYVVKSLVSLGEYGEALKVSSEIERNPSKAVEEILLMRASSYLRRGNFKSAELELRLLLRNVVNLRLSALYWLRVSLKNQNKLRALKKVDAQILKSYPFSYYGILVAKETQGSDFFNRYKKYNFIKQTFSETLSLGEIARLDFYYSYGQSRYFKRAFKSFEKKLNPLQRSLFSLVFKNLDDQLEVIRSLNFIWDLDGQVRMQPFISSSFPVPYQKEIQKATKKLHYTNDALVYAVMRQESAFGPNAKSPSGARGLMQLLPSTAKDVARQMRYRKYRRSGDLYKPGINVHLGAKYMDRLIAAGKGYLPYAFASYNAGPGRMYRWSKERPEITDLRLGLKKEGFNPIDELWIEELPWSETRFYTKALLRNMGIYMALKGDQSVFNCTPFWTCHEKNL